ncbi:hypothetical protein JW796_02485 [Candidatus Dojkabacteria bacterium]|nr:hypothetical protein [Candidatus Dojkabacteria bacterium]
MHKAKALVVSCIDFRFQLYVQEWLKEKGYLGHCDEIVLAGSSRDMVKPLEEFHRDSLARQIDLSVKLHDPDEIIIIDHQDCGGYAQDGTIPGELPEGEDKEKHVQYAGEIKEILEKKYPGKNIKNYYLSLKGEMQEI